MPQSPKKKSEFALSPFNSLVHLKIEPYSYVFLQNINKNLKEKKNSYLLLMGGQSTSLISPLAVKLRIEINPNE